MKRTYAWITTGIILIIICGVSLSVLVADRQGERDSRERARTVLADSAAEQAVTFSVVLNGQYQLLEALSAALSAAGQATDEQRNEQLHQLTAQLGLDNIRLVNADGQVLGNELNVADRDYLHAALRGQRGLDCVLGRLYGENLLVLSVPLYENGQVGGALTALYYTEQLRDLVKSEAYQGAGYTLISDADGRVVLHTKSSDTLSNGDLSDLEQCEFEPGFSYQQLLAAMAGRRSGTCAYTWQEQERMLAYLPLSGEGLPDNDLYLLVGLTTTALENEQAADLRSDAAQTVIITGCCLLALAMLAVAQYLRRRELKREAEAIRFSEERYRIVAEQSCRHVLRYDIASRTSFRDASTPDGFGGADVVVNAAETTIALGLVDESSREDFRAFFRRIDAGESPLSADVLLVRQDGCRRWYRYSSTTLFGDDKRPKTAVISYYDCTEQREQELAYAKWQQELAAMPPERITLSEWNLSRDLPDDAGKTSASALPARPSYSEAIRDYVQQRAAEEDRAALAAFCSRERLIGAYHSGAYQGSSEYRERQADGSASWREMSVQLVPYPDSDEIKCYLMLRDIDAEKRAELELIARSEQDALTGALNRDAFIKSVSRLLAAEPQGSHALLMLDVDEFKRVNDSFGHDVGDELLRSFSQAMRSALRGGDLVGRVGGDEFMVLLADITSSDLAARKAAQLSEALCLRLSNGLTVSASIGGAMYPQDGQDFDQLYKRADSALYQIKRGGKNSYAFYQADMGAEQDALTAFDADA